MDFKCKYCNGTKYRQISVMVKQCEECGRQIASEGVVDDKLDFSEEKDEKEINLDELKIADGLIEQLKAIYTTLSTIDLRSKNIYYTENGYVQ